MRIIAGEHRGRRIAAPPGRSTRPMLDRVREAMFSTLGDLVPDACVLDLFAGSGSLGLEALSRGARHARFVESAPDSLRTLRANVELLGVGDRAAAVRDDASRPAAWGAGEPFDLVFLDPPYAFGEGELGEKRLALLVDELHGRLEPPGMLVLHVERRAVIAGRWAERGFDVRGYGGSALVYVPARERARRGDELAHRADELAHRADELAHRADELAHRADDHEHRPERLAHRADELAHRPSERPGTPNEARASEDPS